MGHIIVGYAATDESGFDMLRLLLLLLGLCCLSARGFVVVGRGPRSSMHRCATRMQASEPEPAKAKRVLVVGGTGRVGGSTVRALKALGLEGKQGPPPLAVSVGGRSPENFEKAKARWAALGAKQGLGEGAFEDVGFVQLDHEDPAALVEALRAAKPNLILHTAGPFQRRKAPEVLKAALLLKCPYVDVCDDIDLSQVAKGYHEEARNAGVPMLISTGVWPGISSLMAVDVAEALGGSKETNSIDFQFYTAGSGGAGTTILRSVCGCEKASMG